MVVAFLSFPLELVHHHLLPRSLSWGLCPAFHVCVSSILCPCVQEIVSVCPGNYDCMSRILCQCVQEIMSVCPGNYVCMSRIICQCVHAKRQFGRECVYACSFLLAFACWVRHILSVLALHGRGLCGPCLALLY